MGNIKAESGEKESKKQDADNKEAPEKNEDSGVEMQPGQIYEQSTKSISDMASYMSETASLVSSMKEGLERVNKIADVIYGDPLSFTPENEKFSAIPDQNATRKRMADYDPIVDPVKEHTKENLEVLKSDTESIREELEQFQNNIKQKESELIEFREKLNQARMQAKGFGNQQGLESLSLEKTVPMPSTDQFDQTSEFDSIPSNTVGFNSINENDDTLHSPDLQQQIKDGEKKLLELRWKIKKAETEYEKRKVEKDEMQDLSSQIKDLESKRDLLRTEIKKLEFQNKEPRQELKELEQKIEQAKKEFDEMKNAKQELEDVRSVLEYLKLDKESLKTDLDELRSKIKNSEKEFEEKRKAKDELEDVRFEVIKLKAEKETIASEIDNLQTKIRKSEAEIEEKRQEKEKLGEFKAI